MHCVLRHIKPVPRFQRVFLFANPERDFSLNKPPDFHIAMLVIRVRGTGGIPEDVNSGKSLLPEPGL